MDKFKIGDIVKEIGAAEPAPEMTVAAIERKKDEPSVVLRYFCNNSTWFYEDMLELVRSAKARELDEHKVTNHDDELIVTVGDDPGAGGANHLYVVHGAEATHNASFKAESMSTGSAYRILFQNGTVPKAGANGLTHEVLIVILMDRLRGFQRGDFACKENACALTHLEEALHWLQQRTLKRLRRGVEGTHTV